jgi:N6-adenosine-specific RNA methylase IME4
VTRFDIIYADPPWQYRNVKTGGSHTSGAAQKYQTMSLDELSAMPVGSIAAKNSLLALWGTTPFGMDPYLLMERWGFKFITEIYWHKIGRKGTGYWLRGDVEKLLIGKRGTVKAWRFNHSNHIALPTLGHSKKPPYFRQLLADRVPGPRIELFATERFEEWDCYGLALDPAHDFRKFEFWHGLTTAKEAA